MQKKNTQNTEPEYMKYACRWMATIRDCRKKIIRYKKNLKCLSCANVGESDSCGEIPDWVNSTELGKCANANDQLFSFIFHRN